MHQPYESLQSLPYNVSKTNAKHETTEWQQNNKPQWTQGRRKEGSLQLKYVSGFTFQLPVRTNGEIAKGRMGEEATWLRGKAPESNNIG